jgi:hypothetical protein
MSEVKIYTCERGNGNIAQAGLLPLFPVSDYIRVHAILGVVTDTEIQAQANDAKLVANPTTGADVDLCVAAETNGDAIGTMYTITGDFSDALIPTTSGAVETTDYKIPFIVAPGTIDMHCVASSTGKVKWTLIWSPVNASASVSAA